MGPNNGLYTISVLRPPSRLATKAFRLSTFSLTRIREEKTALPIAAVMAATCLIERPVMATGQAGPF